jgi:hypothetical protein
LHNASIAIGEQAYCCNELIFNDFLAETDESIPRVGARSPGRSRRYPRFSPGAWAVGCAHLHFPPKATEPVLQSSARQCMCVRGTLWSYPREINQARLRSLRESDELVAEDHLLRQLQVLTARRLISPMGPLARRFLRVRQQQINSPIEDTRQRLAVVGPPGRSGAEEFRKCR